MPNPFMKLGTPVQSKDPERPTGAVTPVPEVVVGTVFPYRGMETHGVAPTQDWRNTADYEGDYDGEGPVAYEPIPDNIDPIPVFIVETEAKGRQIERGTCFRGYAGANSAQNVLSADYQGRRRRSAKIKNLDATVVYIGYSADQATPISGWPLVTNEVFEAVGEDDVWAYGIGANPSQLAVATEYAVTFDGN